MNLKRLSALALTAVIALGAFSPVQAAKKNAWATEYLNVLKKMDESDKKNKKIHEKELENMTNNYYDSLCNYIKNL